MQDLLAASTQAHEEMHAAIASEQMQASLGRVSPTTQHALRLTATLVYDGLGTLASDSM